MSHKARKVCSGVLANDPGLSVNIGNTPNTMVEASTAEIYAHHRSLRANFTSEYDEANLTLSIGTDE